MMMKNNKDFCNDICANASQGARYGLLGASLKHSFSPEIHKKIGTLIGCPYDYVLFEKRESEVEEFLKCGEWSGLNVTIPYKQTVMPYCDELSAEAKAIGAVNTLVKRDGKIYGYNTDYTGFKKSLQHNGVPVHGSKALILGSGGASKAVYRVLCDMGAERVEIVSRNGELSYDNVYELRGSDTQIIVNATPVGMYPNNGKSPIFPGNFPKLELAADLIYNPLRTNFLCQAKKSCIEYMSGMKMLVLQAAASAELFLGCKVSVAVTEQIEKELSMEKKNIVLIGMPGAGKTTVGGILAGELSRSFYDIDEMIVAMAGKSIPQIFADDGEEAFRQIESEAVVEVSKVTGAVIACGGGVVTREENYYPLAENGHIVFLNRDISLLSTVGRPVSQAVPAERLYRMRLPLYRGWCDDEIEITEYTPEAAALHIIDML